MSVPGDKSSSEKTKLLPEGEYPVVIVHSEEKVSKAGNKYLNLRLKVSGGKDRGFVLWDILNLWNKNRLSKEMARKRWASIREFTVGCRVVEESSEVHDIPFRAYVVVEPGTNGWGDKNKIVHFLAAADGDREEATKIRTVEVSDEELNRQDIF